MSGVTDLLMVVDVSDVVISGTGGSKFTSELLDCGDFGFCDSLFGMIVCW